MKTKLWKKMIITLTAAVTVFVMSGTTLIYASGDYEREAFTGRIGEAPAIDGSFSGWEDIPVTYEYNWDNSANCWYWGMWVDGVCYKTEVGTYDTNVRHAVQLYTDSEYVYYHIIFARDFSTGQIANSNDYQFFIDQNKASLMLELENGGGSLSGKRLDEGIYEIDAKHSGGAVSYGTLVDGAVAYYKVNDGNVNNEIEIKVPLSELVKQNPNIDMDNFNRIDFTCPNLMYRPVSAAGSSSGAVFYGITAFTVVPAAYIIIKKRKKGVHVSE